jgi:hypothetical protein
MLVVSIAGCAQVPGMPPDYMLPVQDIVLHAACELRTSLTEIKTAHPSFLAHPWAISIGVTPKIDADLSLRAGLTGKSSSVTVPYFNTWVVGSAPGAQYDMKGHTDGGVSYSIKSSELLDEKKYPLNCDRSSAKYHALASQLGIHDWLNRTAAAAEGPISKLTRIDKPTYNSQVIATWDGSGSFTYNYPFGTDFFGAYGQYKVDESVAIGFTAEPNPPTRKVRTLPGGTEYSSIPVPTAAPVSIEAQNRLDLLSLQQSIINLETALGRRR